ncbi:MAG TPA: hypothetical protein VII35_15460 [Steroidobacteraceae bacterium]
MNPPLVIFGSGLLAGAMNALAGGGTFVARGNDRRLRRRSAGCCFAPGQRVAKAALRE